MKLPPYPKYKSSGVDWLGDVPAHWEVKRVKHVGVIRYGLGEPPEYVDEGLPFIRATDIKHGKVDLDEVKQVSRDDVPWRRRPQLASGEILVVRSGAYTGDSAIVSAEIAGCIAGYDMVFTVQKAHAPFVAWALLSEYMLHGQIYLERLRAAQPHLNAEELGGFFILVPPLLEQLTIAAFLDRETERIDRLVSKKRELIERLKEKRIALISRTVTRGLPPAAARAASLPENPALKPTGLEWIGDIPAHWEMNRLKFELWKIEQGWSPQCDNSPANIGEWGVLKAGAVNGPEFEPQENKRLPDEETPLKKYEIKTGDFLISRANTRDLLGSAALVRKVRTQLLLCDKLYRLRIRKRTLNTEFLLRFMRSTPGHHEFERDASGSSASMQNIGQDCVRNLWIPLPPIPEQAAIVSFLDAETAKLYVLVAKIEEAVERLLEYRTALITAAVTGKINVRKANS